VEGERGKWRCLTDIEEDPTAVVQPGFTVPCHCPDRQCHEGRDEGRKLHGDDTVLLDSTSKGNLMKL
jgi:hypothetical protein